MCYWMRRGGGLFAHVGLQVALSVRERLAGLGTVGKSASGLNVGKGLVSFISPTFVRDPEDHLLLFLKMFALSSSLYKYMYTQMKTMFCFPSVVLATEDNAVVGVDTVYYQVNGVPEIQRRLTRS